MGLSWNRLLNTKIVFFLIFSAICDTAFSLNFPKEPVRLNGKTYILEVAKTPDQHETGLMRRRSLGEDEGMLFVFDQQRILKFWMKNTLIDLDIGYFDKFGRLIEVQQMQSVGESYTGPLTSYPSAKPARYAIEMNKGWFKKNNINTGALLVFPVLNGTSSSQNSLKSKTSKK